MRCNSGSMNPDQPLAFLGGLTARDFMNEYWQKKPLFVPNALPGFSGTLEADELAGLACEELADSRIVLHDPEQHRWQLRRGPFQEEDFSRLPEENWTLLVTDVDQWHAETEQLLQLIDFIPRWRVDDVMVSYATAGGSVGPHLDQYDVFLLQGPGRRRWQIAAPEENPDLLPEHELAILARFEAEQEWITQPGDLLYLPPGIPHYGVALEPAMTWSLGMRAPALADLVTAYAEHIAETLPADALLRDPELPPCENPWQLGPDHISLFRKNLDRLLRQTDDAWIPWLGKWLTGTANHWPAPAENPLDSHALQQALATGHALFRAPWARTLWHEQMLFIAGEALLLPNKDAQTLASNHCVDLKLWNHLEAATQNHLATLHARGLYALGDDA